MLASCPPWTAADKQPAPGEWQPLRLSRRSYGGVVANEAGAPRPASRTASVRAGLTFGSAALLVAAVATAFLLASAFEAAHRTIGWVVACSVVALLIDPLVDFVGRVTPRWVAVIIVLIVLLAIAGSVIASLYRDVTDSLDELRESAPAAAQALEEKYDWMAEIDVAKRVEDFVSELDDRARRQAVTGALGTVPTYLVTGILMLFILAYGRRYFDAFVDQFSGERRARIATIGSAGATRGRRYLLVALAQAIIGGLVVGLTCWLLDLPAAASLGVLAGALTILPLIGVIVGGVPALLLAFGLEGWGSAMWVAAVLIVLQVIEGAVVRPYVDARTVRLGPTVPIIVGLLGFELYGLGGAVYGIAVAVIALAALDAAGTDAVDEPAPAVAEPAV